MVKFIMYEQDFQTLPHNFHILIFQNNTIAKQSNFEKCPHQYSE